MRLLFFILISFASYGQLSTELTVHKQFERLPKDLSDVIYPTFEESLINDYYGIRVNYQTNRLIFGLGVSYLNKDYHLNERELGNVSYKYSADVRSSSLGLRIDAGYQFFDSWFNLIPNIFLQTDLLLTEVESNHYSANWYNAYSPGGASYTYGSDSYEAFDAVRNEPVHIMAGLSLEPRFNIDKVYLSLLFDAGLTRIRKQIADPEHIQSEPSKVEPELIKNGQAYFGYGLKIGYQFGK